MPDQDPFAAYALPAKASGGDDPFADYAVQAKAPAAAPSGWTLGSVARGAGQLLGYVGDALPTIGGIVGGVVGGVPGAAAGGAAGEGYRDVVNHASEIPGAVVDVARNLFAHPKETIAGAIGGAGRGALDAGEEGAGQAVGQLAGEGLAKAAGMTSKWLMNRATTRVSAKLMRDFPELSDTLIDNAITVSKGGEEKARALLMAAKGRANFALAKADGTVPVAMTKDLAESLKTALLEKAVKSGAIAPIAAGEPLVAASERLSPEMANTFRRIEMAAEGSGKLHLTAQEADLLKTQLQKESRALYANRTAPNGQAAMGMDATERAEYASRLNDALDGIAPGYKAANAEAKPLIGALRGVQQATRPNGNLLQAMVRPAVGAATGGAIGGHEGGTPGSVAGAMVGAAMTSPAGMSREAIMLAHPWLQAALKQMPAGAAQLLIDALSGQSNQPPQE